MRTGREYLKALNDGRKVWVGDELVDNVVAHPKTRAYAQRLADFYDRGFPRGSPTWGQRSGPLRDNGWARADRRILREAGQAVRQARAVGHTTLHESEHARIEKEFLNAARCGISVNPNNGGKKPKARRLAERLAAKAHQVLCFT